MTTEQDFPEQLTITLRKPVIFGTNEYTELILSEPSAGAVRDAQKALASEGAMACNILLVALVTGIPKPAVEKIGWRDLDKAAKYLAGFMSDGPKTGETP